MLDFNDLIYLSMSAFGTGNEWSDTRAYGSVLEQGSGLPSFCGRDGDPALVADALFRRVVHGYFGRKIACDRGSIRRWYGNLRNRCFRAAGA